MVTLSITAMGAAEEYHYMVLVVWLGIANSGIYSLGDIYSLVTM